MLVARSFAPPPRPEAVAPGQSPGAGATGAGAGPTPVVPGDDDGYDGPVLRGVFVSCVPGCDLLAFGAGDPRALTSTAEAIDESAPAISPDGTRVAFRCANPGAPGSICLADIAGGPTTTLLEGGSADYDGPAWSPDGSMLAVEVVEGGGPPAIQLVDLASGAQRPFSVEVDGARSPAWSPDGTRLAFACDRGAPDLQPDATQFCLAPIDGGPLLALGAVDGPCGVPTFAPDGAMLAAACVVPGAPGADLFLLSTAEALARSVTGSQDISPEGRARVVLSHDARYAYVRRDDALWAIALPAETWTRLDVPPLYGDFDLVVAE